MAKKETKDRRFHLQPVGQMMVRMDCDTGKTWIYKEGAWVEIKEPEKK